MFAGLSSLSTTRVSPWACVPRRKALRQITHSAVVAIVVLAAAIAHGGELTVAGSPTYDPATEIGFDYGGAAAVKNGLPCATGPASVAPAATPTDGVP